MLSHKPSATTDLTLHEVHTLETLPHMPALRWQQTPAVPIYALLIRLDEINEERHQAYRQALANVYAAFDPEQPVRLLYLLDGGPDGVSLYIGVMGDSENCDLHENLKNLRGALEGQLPGINFGEPLSVKQRDELLARIRNMPEQGVMLGLPTIPEGKGPDNEDSFQGIERIVRAISTSTRSDQPSHARWQIAVVSQPLSRAQVSRLLDETYRLSSHWAALIRTSIQSSGSTSRQKGTSIGTSFSETLGTSHSETLGKSESTSQGKTWGESSSVTATTGSSQTKTLGKSESATEGKNWSESSSSGRSSGTSQSITYGKNENFSEGTTQSQSSSISSSKSGAETKTFGTNESTTTGSSTSKTESVSENYSESDTTGSSLAITRELADKKAEHCVEYLDKQLIPRLQKGLSKGLYQTVVYLGADNHSVYQRLKHTVRATFQGSEITMTPLEIYDLPTETRGQVLSLPTVADVPSREQILFHSLYLTNGHRLGTLLTSEELATIAGLPSHELPGIRRRKTVSFVVDLPDVAPEEAIDLGAVIDRGRAYANNRVLLARADLNKHIFVTGVTGAGKTTTCLNLLLESGLPFLVIEPAKTEYRELVKSLGRDIDYYRPNGDDHQSLRINPFALLRRGQRIKSHAAFLKNVLAAVFPMEASMPMMVEAAILAAYEDKGWDIDSSEYLFHSDPFDPLAGAWPTMSDMIRMLDRLIPTYGLGKEFEEKYRGSLVSRLRSLSDGTLGEVVNVPQSIDFEALLKRRAVIELEELQSGEEKAIIMALLLSGLSEAVRAIHARDPGFRQITLIEEAHRLLARPESGDRTAAMAVEAFADMLAEVRKYGVGLIIADQIPAKLVPDVIKNTHCKIVHRLFAEDDRRTMGEAMMMNDDQRDFLPNLGTGEAIVFCGGWHGPVHARIRNDRAQTGADVPIDLNACGIRQLWRERHRYCPRFCRLGWLSCEEDDPEVFAQFIRETCRAQNHLLRIASWLRSGKTQEDRRVCVAFDRLKTWQKRWQTRAAAQQARYAEWRTQQAGLTSPQTLLAAAWHACLCDANPRPHAQEKNVAPLRPSSPEEASFLAQTVDSLFDLLAQCPDLGHFKEEVSAPRARDLRAHLEHLAQYKGLSL